VSFDVACLVEVVVMVVAMIVVEMNGGIAVLVELVLVV
jgi:hypothetical protein